MVTPVDNNTVRWEATRSAAKRQLVLKKVALAAIALVNLAILGASVYAVLHWCPVSSRITTTAMISSPFIVGILAALTHLKFPTYGITRGNYSEYSNPAHMAGKVLAYIFFAPLMLAVRHSDWTAYHDPEVVERISLDLEEKSFADISKSYGAHFENMAHFGVLPEENLGQLTLLHEVAKVNRRALAHYEKKGLLKSSRAEFYKTAAERIEENWQKLHQKRVISHLPHPALPERDFTHWRLGVVETTSGLTGT